MFLTVCCDSQLIGLSELPTHIWEGGSCWSNWKGKVDISPPLSAEQGLWGFLWWGVLRMSLLYWKPLHFHLLLLVYSPSLSSNVTECKTKSAEVVYLGSIMNLRCYAQKDITETANLVQVVSNLCIYKNYMLIMDIMDFFLFIFCSEKQVDIFKRCLNAHTIATHLK